LYCTAIAFLGKCVFLQDSPPAISNLESHREGAVNMYSKEQKRLATTRELMGNAKERTDLSSEVEQDLENLGLQRRMKQLELESKLLKNQNDELV
jgi:hypothetical protein